MIYIHHLGQQQLYTSCSLLYLTQFVYCPKVCLAYCCLSDRVHSTGGSGRHRGRFRFGFAVIYMVLKAFTCVQLAFARVFKWYRSKPIHCHAGSVIQMLKPMHSATGNELGTSIKCQKLSSKHRMKLSKENQIKIFLLKYGRLALGLKLI